MRSGKWSSEKALNNNNNISGLTNQNYQELQQLYDKVLGWFSPTFLIRSWSDETFQQYNQDLEILAFPCNNFGGQEPGTNAEVVEFAKDKGATFPVLGKLECDNGDKTAPLYKFLMNSIEDKGTTGFVLGQGLITHPSHLIWSHWFDPISSLQGLKWNFAKFLCDKDGKPVKRRVSSPQRIMLDIEYLFISYFLPQQIFSHQQPTEHRTRYCRYYFQRLIISCEEWRVVDAVVGMLKDLHEPDQYIRNRAQRIEMTGAAQNLRVFKHHLDHEILRSIPTMNL